REGIVPGRGGHGLLGAGAVVARGRDDGDPGEPGALDRPVERVEHERAVVGPGQREVRNANSVLILVRDDPVEPGDDVARVTHAVVVEDVDGDELRARGGACAAGRGA